MQIVGCAGAVTSLLVVFAYFSLRSLQVGSAGCTLPAACKYVRADGGKSCGLHLMCSHHHLTGGNTPDDMNHVDTSLPSILLIPGRCLLSFLRIGGALGTFDYLHLFTASFH